MLIVWFAYVEHTNILSVDKLMNRLIALQVDIETCCLHYCSECSIFDTTIVVVTTITNLQSAISDIRFCREEWIVEVLIPAKFLFALEFERVGRPCTTPSSTHLKIYILIENHIALLVDIRHVYRAFPVHIPVARLLFPIARYTIYTLHIYSQ